MRPTLDLATLDDHLLDLNNVEKIPKNVLTSFWEIKKELGSLALGIVFYPEEGWFVVDSMGTVYSNYK